MFLIAAACHEGQKLHLCREAKTSMTSSSRCAMGSCE